MAGKEELLDRIRAVDREMDEIVRKNPAVQIAYQPVRFPFGAWILGLGFAGSWAYGQGTAPIPPQYWDYQLYASIVFLFLAVILSLRKILHFRKSGSKAYREANERLVALREQKSRLRVELSELE